MSPVATSTRRPTQFLLKELLAVTLDVGVWAGIWQQGSQTSVVLLAASIPLAGPCLMLWGSIFERRWLEASGAAMTLCVPLLLLLAALVPPLLAASR